MPVRDRLLEFEAKRNEHEEKEEKKIQQKRKKKKTKEVMCPSHTGLKTRVELLDFDLTLLKDEIMQMQNLFTSISMSDSDIEKMRKQENQIDSHYTKLMLKIKQFSSITCPFAVQRIKDTQVYRLNYDLRKTMVDFWTSQLKYNEEATTRLNRDKKIMTESDVDECSVFLNTQNQSASAICTAEAHNSTLNLQVRQQQRKQIKDLENDVSELNRLFNTMVRLVQYPDLMLDNIEQNIQKADCSIMNASIEFESAERSRNALKRKRIKWIVISLILIAVVLIILILVMIFKL